MTDTTAQEGELCPEPIDSARLQVEHSTRVKVARALDSAQERLDLALAYLRTQGRLDSAQRVERVLEELRLAWMVDDQLTEPREPYAGPPSAPSAPPEAPSGTS